MTHSRFRTFALTAACTVLGITATACGTDTPAPASDAAPAAPAVGTAFGLPGDHTYPEGIATDPRTGDTYVGSYATGAVYRAARGARTAEVFLPEGTDDRHTANGLKVDRDGHLWVTDSTRGVIVYDTGTRAALARFDVPGDGPRFVNDLAIGADGTAYVTDSVRGVVYAITPGQLRDTAEHGGRAAMTARFDLTALLAPRAPGAFNLNGIVAAANYLLVVDMVPGELYRVALAPGTANPIAKVTLRGGDMTNGDGLELRGDTLWVAQNTVDTISRWSITDDGSTATRTAQFTDPALEIPTTLVRADDRILSVASQFDRGGPMGPGTPGPFKIVAVTGI